MNQTNQLDVLKLINQYQDLVRQAARVMSGKLASSVQIDDLVQSGMMGLMDAWKNFDPKRGVPFEGFAMLRIKGAMLDDLRKSDWVPRAVHRESRQINEAIHVLEQKKQGPVHDQEVSDSLGITVQEYQKLLASINYRVLLSSDELSELYGEDAYRSDRANGTNNPEDCVESIDFNNYLSGLVDHLSRQEKMVLKLYYNDDLNLKEISDILRVSESRVSQIHSQAVKMLRENISN